MHQHPYRYVVMSFIWMIASALLVGCTSGQVPDAPQATVPTEEKNAMLITPQSLEARLTDKTLRILDVRPAAEYDAGHIRGAVRIDLAAWKSLGLSDGGLQDATAWAKNVGSLGIGLKTPVAVYGGKLNDAARAWWILKYVGLSDVRLLDGDWAAWKAAGRPVETNAVNVTPTDFQPRFQGDRLARTEDVRRYGNDPKVVILDARGAREYSAGHVPGAVHLDWNDLLTDSGRFQSPQELRAVFEKVPVEDAQTVVTYCKSGSRSSAQAFALELAGYKNVKNYFRSWQQWSSEVAAPVDR
ncbi:MAG: sulfurtransferase [Thermoguttaceae bacterium]